MRKKISFLMIILGLAMFLISPALASNAKQRSLPATPSSPPSSLPGLPASGVEGLPSLEEIQAMLQRQGNDRLAGTVSGQLAVANEATKALGESLTQEQRQAISAAFAKHEPTLKGLIAQTEALKNQPAGKTVDLGKAQELYAQVKNWETTLNAEVENVLTGPQRSQFQASLPTVPDPQGDAETLKALGIEPSGSGSEGTGGQPGGSSYCYYGYYYGYYGNLYAYYGYIYSYYAYYYTGSGYCYYAYLYNSYAYTYSYYGYLYNSYAYSYSNATYAYYAYLYSYYGYTYAYYGYLYGYYGYAYTGHTYAYYSYYYGYYGYIYCYYGYTYGYYCYVDTNTPSQKILSVTRYSQETNNWCWAASAQMVMYYVNSNYNIPQCYQASRRFFPNNNLNYCCSDPQKNSTSYCNKGGWGDSSFNYWGFTYNTTESYISWDGLVGQINNNKPIWYAWVWAPFDWSNGGHALVAKGYSSNGSYVNYWDPWYQNTGDYWITYDAMVSNSEHRWIYTYYNISR